VAAQAVAEGWVVVSGHAAGVDATAHRVALENGGSTIIVAPQGILDFKLRRELKQIAKPEQLLIISEFPPKARWNVGYAMQRNRTILALSNAMVLVEARTEGRTFEAGKQALQLKVPLFVIGFENPAQSASGNSYFLEQGAIPLLKNKHTGKANLDALKQEVQTRGEFKEGMFSREEVQHFQAQLPLITPEL
jgi:predicted Rossmann fold nucleotide-binding protein DprA/Smf involved in DNA uptake